MEFARNIILATASAILVGLAGCAATRSSNALADSAAALDRNAHALAAQSDAMSPALEQDAHQLAASTLQFHSVVSANATDNASAKTAFESVSRNYQKVNDDVNQVNTANARAALRPVTEAYQAVERAMGAHS